MSDETTPRFGLPLLAAGQAAKEITHNEALSLIDLLVQPAVQAAGTNTPPADPAPGQCWIVGDAPTGAWSEHAHELAGWTAGGWRFAAPREGSVAWSISQATPIAYREGLWHEGDVAAGQLVIGGQRVVGARRPAIADPAGGTTVDDNARATITAILTTLRQHGLIAA